MTVLCSVAMTLSCHVVLMVLRLVGMTTLRPVVMLVLLNWAPLNRFRTKKFTRALFGNRRRDTHQDTFILMFCVSAMQFCHVDYSFYNRPTGCYLTF